MIQTFKHSHLYVTDYARICPFLLSMSRNMTSKIVEKYTDNVVWIHTDGFILNKPIKINTGVEIGDLHMECHGYCYVKNVNDVTHCVYDENGIMTDEIGEKFK